MSKELVKSFDALPQPLIDTRPVSAHCRHSWHFDLRYSHLEPNPGHELAMFHPQDKRMFMERLPMSICVPGDDAGRAYFPATPREAAPEIVKCLLEFFIRHRHDKSYPPAPWTLSTGDKALGDAVGTELKRLAVSPSSLYSVAISSARVIKLVNAECRKITQSRLSPFIFFEDVQVDVVQPPVIFDFGNGYRPYPPVSGDSETRLITELTVMHKNISPCDGTPFKGYHVGNGVDVESYPGVHAFLDEYTEQRINSMADRGDVEAAMQYSLRLILGLRCQRNWKRARLYALKMLTLPDISDSFRAKAHGILVYWYMHTAQCRGDPCRRYFYAACHHAEAAAIFCERISPPGALSSPIVMKFLLTMYGPQTGDMLPFFYMHLSVVEDRAYKISQAKHKGLVNNRKKNINRFRCAAPDCNIETDRGCKLHQCAGPCDKQVKPSYCGTECERADWELHKPFCRPGAPSSVTKTSSEDILLRAQGKETSPGLLFLPTTHRDGSVTLLGSATYRPAELRNIQKELAESGALDEGNSFIRREKKKNRP